MLEFSARNLKHEHPGMLTQNGVVTLILCLVFALSSAVLPKSIGSIGPICTGHPR
jgi:hypothetical protein